MQHSQNRKCSIRSIRARTIIGRKRGLAGIGTKLVGVKRLNTLLRTNQERCYRNGIEGYGHDVEGKYCISTLVYGRCGK